MKIAFVGEAYGNETEVKMRMPFLGWPGQELAGQLEDAGIIKRECFFTNVFNLQPEKNDVKSLCVSKKMDTLGLPPITTGAYLRAEYAPELTRLFNELETIRPNIIVALGGTALWALTGDARITKHRGTCIAASPVLGGESLRGTKVIATYHPGAIIKQYSLRPVAVADLIKARRQSEFPEIRKPRYELWLEPTLQDLAAFNDRHITGASILSFDIETAREQITCIGFATGNRAALCIPFFDPRRGGNYWPTDDDERKAWGFVRTVLNLGIPKVTQNGLYDVHWLWRRYGIPVKNLAHDTMLLHHALQPEAQKGLAFLGSIYTDAPAWKSHRVKKINQTSKKEDA